MTPPSLIERKLVQADQTAKEDAIRFARASQERKKSELQLNAARERFWGDVARIAQSAAQPGRVGVARGGGLQTLEESRRHLSAATKKHNGALKTLYESGRTFDKSTATVKALKQEISVQRTRRETTRTNRADEELIAMALARSVQAGRMGVPLTSKNQRVPEGFGSANPINSMDNVVRREHRSPIEGDSNGNTMLEPATEMQRDTTQTLALERPEVTQSWQIKEAQVAEGIPILSSVQSVMNGRVPAIRLTCRLSAGCTIGIEVAAAIGAAPRIAITSETPALHAVLERERSRILEQLKEAGVRVTSLTVKSGPVESESSQSYARSRRRFGDDHERVGT